jgi:hypothetical protein
MPGQFPHASNMGVPATDLQFAAMVRIDQVGGMTKPAKCVRKRLVCEIYSDHFPFRITSSTESSHPIGLYWPDSKVLTVHSRTV